VVVLAHRRVLLLPCRVRLSGCADAALRLIRRGGRVSSRSSLICGHGFCGGILRRVSANCVVFVLGNLVCWGIAVFCIAFLVLATFAYSRNNTEDDGRQVQGEMAPLVITRPAGVF
jgi:hypothetical protein